MSKSLNDVKDQLSAFFSVDSVKWKVQKVTKDKKRAMAVAYIDARDVIDRLDEAVGPAGWSDDYEAIQLGAKCNVVCRLTVLGVTKTDVGELSGGDWVDPGKTGFSDAFKRAAVKFGIGRYLYKLPKRWVGYNAEKKQLSETPKLPTWAIPKSDPGKAHPATKPPARKPTTTEEKKESTHWAKGHEKEVFEFAAEKYGFIPDQVIAVVQVHEPVSDLVIKKLTDTTLSKDAVFGWIKTKFLAQQKAAERSGNEDAPPF